ncbi:MAG TPA: NYN domain-containing protein [Ignavibacteria bacterium]|nr:NYN domain-containing protein [Ignavibacteria bacterium]
MNHSQKRVITYIDGFNLYFGLKSKNWKKFYWLNLKEFSKNLLVKDQKLIKTKYFTSRVKDNPTKQKRQNTFIDALETLEDFEIYYGKYQQNKVECYNCHYIFSDQNEKMTDVNIATEILCDAFNDLYDIAILISGDSDLIPPIKAVQNQFPDKRIVVAFPPERFNKSVKEVAKGSFIIGKSKLQNSLFPDELMSKSGFLLKKPTEWN